MYIHKIYEKVYTVSQLMQSLEGKSFQRNILHIWNTEENMNIKPTYKHFVTT